MANPDDSSAPRPDPSQDEQQLLSWVPTANHEGEDEENISGFELSIKAESVGITGNIGGHGEIGNAAEEKRCASSCAVEDQSTVEEGVSQYLLERSLPPIPEEEIPFPKDSAETGEVLRESVQVLYEGLRQAFDHCGNIECQVKGLSKRFDSIEDKMNSFIKNIDEKTSCFEGHMAKHLQRCLDREGEHFKNVWNSVRQVCMQEREARNQDLEQVNQRLEEVRKAIAEENAQARVNAEECELRTMRKFAEVSSEFSVGEEREMKNVREVTNDKVEEVQHDVECLRRHLAKSSSPTQRHTGLPHSVTESSGWASWGGSGSSPQVHSLGRDSILNMASPCLSRSATEDVTEYASMPSNEGYGQAQSSAAHVGTLARRGAAPFGPRASGAAKPLAPVMVEVNLDDVSMEGIPSSSRGTGSHTAHIFHKTVDNVVKRIDEVSTGRQWPPDPRASRPVTPGRSPFSVGPGSRLGGDSSARDSWGMSASGV